MNRQELQERLNELLKGKGATYNATLCDYIYKNLDELFIDNTEGVWGVMYDNYTFTIVYKNMRFVSFEVKRQAGIEYRWIVKEVVVDIDFVNYTKSLEKIKEKYKEQAKRFDSERYDRNAFRFDDLKETLRTIKGLKQRLTKGEIQRLIKELDWYYWLVDEALESEGK